MWCGFKDNFGTCLKLKPKFTGWLEWIPDIAKIDSVHILQASDQYVAITVLSNYCKISLHEIFPVCLLTKRFLPWLYLFIYLSVCLPVYFKFREVNQFLQASNFSRSSFYLLLLPLLRHPLCKFSLLRPLLTGDFYVANLSISANSSNLLSKRVAEGFVNAAS